MPHDVVVIVEIVAKDLVITTSVVLGETGSLTNSLHTVVPSDPRQDARTPYAVYVHGL